MSTSLPMKKGSQGMEEGTGMPHQANLCWVLEQENNVH